MDSTALILIIVGVVVVAAIAVVGMRVARRKRSQRLREQYGPEYERAVQEHGGRREAESKLRDREKQHKKLDLKDLSQHQRDDYDRRWTDIQARFVDDPSDAVRSADHLVVEVMKVRGYPVDDFDQRAESLSVDHPKTTSRYREARKISRANEDGTADTEDLRQAVTSYRELVQALVHGEGRGDKGRDRGDERRDDDRRADEQRTEAGRTDAGQHHAHERNGHRDSTATRVQQSERESM